MNIIYLHQKGDPVIQVGGDITTARVAVSGRDYDCFVLPATPGDEIRLKSVLRWYPFSTRPLTTDWLAITGGPAVVDLEVSLIDDAGKICARSISAVGRAPSMVSLPRLVGPSTTERDKGMDLIVRNLARDGSAVTLLVGEVDSAKALLAQAVGIGVELLSGRAADLRPSPERSLFYVGSPKHIEAAAELLAPNADTWSQPLVGASHDIPVVDGGLDFILASNILHRAVNPLGHLALWRSKLRAGGRVLGILPSLAGGAEYLNAPSTLCGWLAQYETGGFVETQAHHNAFAYARDLNPKSLFRRSYPSSFSFFTPANVAEMMAFAVEKLGYEGFHIEHVRNGRHIRFGLYA